MMKLPPAWMGLREKPKGFLFGARISKTREREQAPNSLERHVGLVVLHQSSVVLARLLNRDGKILESDVVDDLVLLAGE